MPIASNASLAEEMHCLTEDGDIVITAQRWTDPAAPADRPRSWVRLVRNGRVKQDAVFTGQKAHRELDQFWTGLAERYEPTSLTEDRMWAALKERTGIGQAQCQGKDCSGALLIAWPYCPLCRRDSRRIACGSLSGVRRRPDLLLDMRARPDSS